MQPVQRQTFLIINPSDSAESANLAFGVRQDASVQPGARPASPRAEGGGERQARDPSTDVRPPTHAAARATLQAHMPPVRRHGFVVSNPQRRKRAAISMIATGGLSAGVSVGLIAHSIASTITNAVLNQNHPSYFPAVPETNQVVIPIAAAAATGAVGSGLVVAGISLLRVRAAPAPTNAVGQVELAPHARPRQRFAVPLQEIVIEPNAVDSSSAAPVAAAAAGSPPTVAQTSDKPDSPRWDAAAASAQLPFANEQG